MEDMLIPPVSNSPSKVQLSRLGHIYFEHPDLEKFGLFAKDFGFVEVTRREDTIYYRGYGKDPYIYVALKSKDGKARCGGGAFIAASKEEFQKAARIPGASAPMQINAPGGGQIITFARPNGTCFHVIFGQEDRQVDTDIPSETHEFQGPYNTPFEKPRLGQFQRYHDGPALIHKIGHFGYVCKEFDTEFEFYTSNFNFVPSDILYHPQFSNVDILAFIHLDLGKEYSEHHVFFLQRAAPEVKKTFLHHSSYEVADFDTQLLGHEWMGKKGWKSLWGVGRHILGSQIFDYWADPSGFKIEHYADGDVVNEDVPTRRDVAGPLSVWGPELPKDFGEDLTDQLSN
ncbi:Glyoxalase/Bleomycin resistance protein/Dihydroxybiphenyl dioxygenase [Fusarium tricinctum]|uniref:Glyoxalase/Bleomycin resistance protein/Dihydroxybiphenyl dioxygenase n=2 Tax=Fusarium tricinctum species complex TaxID=679429 RepID=A0A8K0S1V3_9HYPO|nr:Glyoxalase/Bleomycin resistance protein/Dihydroxybiphenyl dioxygenase [Fusarium tricinctum]